jgi:hypothetical protein
MKGQTPRPDDRQVGAWQSYAVTAYATTNEAQRRAAARVTVPSVQDWEMMEQAETLIDDLAQAVQDFERNAWRPFTVQMKEVALFPF